MTGIICSVDKKWVKKEHHGSFSYDDGTRLYPKSAVTGNLFEGDRMNVEIMYRKKMEAPPPSSQGIYYSYLRAPHTHNYAHTYAHTHKKNYIPSRKKINSFQASGGYCWTIWCHFLTSYPI